MGWTCPGCRGRAAAGAEEPRPGHFTVKSLGGEMGNFPRVLDAASDLKMRAQPRRMRRGAGVQMRSDSARHSNMVTSCPAATAPGRAEGDAPATLASRGEEEEGRAGPGSGGYVRAGTRCPGRWDGTASPTESPWMVLGGGLGATCATAAELWGALPRAR